MSGALVLDFFGELPTFVGVVVSVQGAGTIVGGRRFSMGPSTRSDGTVTVGRAVLTPGLAIVAPAPAACGSPWPLWRF
jgi:hypothetical protein